jgi:hypothetical protein
LSTGRATVRGKGQQCRRGWRQWCRGSLQRDERHRAVTHFTLWPPVWFIPDLLAIVLIEAEL